MQSTETLPVKSWGQVLAQARAEQSRDLGTISRELLLSLAQLRGIETGQTHAFHGQNFYLRAVQKYADHMHITLDPPVSDFQDASPSGTRHTKSLHRASGIASHQSSPPNALHMPAQRPHGARLGRWMILLVLGLVGAGVYMAVSEGWPSRPIDEIVAHKEGSSASLSVNRSAITPLDTTSDIRSDNTSTSISVPASTSSSTVSLEKAAAQTAAQTTSQTNAQSDNTQSQSAAAAASASTAAPVTEPAAVQASANGPASPATGPTTVQTPSPDRTVTDELVLTFNQECWVELLQTNGQSQQRIYKPGEELRVSADQVERLVLGNAQAIQAQRAGKPFDVTQFIRGSGSVARIDAQALARTTP